VREGGNSVSLGRRSGGHDESGRRHLRLLRARAASGHAAPPSSVMNARRL